MQSNTAAAIETEENTPAWVDINFITKVLRTSEQDTTIEVKDFQSKSISSLENHYGSVMYRLVVNFVSAQQAALKTESMIIKAMPECEQKLMEALKDSHVFETEIGMYVDMIPKFHATLRSIGDTTMLGVSCLYHSLAQPKFLIFEDLSSLGYDVLRNRPVTLEEAKIAYRKLAKWHAISYKLSQERPNCFDQFRHSLMNLEMNESNKIMNDFIDSGISKFIEMLETQPKLQQYKQYFMALEANLVAKCRAAFVEYRVQPQPAEHYVLCHGDFHCKNMMFKQNASNGCAEDVMLLDFQLCHMGPMAHDLIYARYMLLDRQLRMEHLNELLEYYYCYFALTLRDIKYKGRILTYSELQESLFRHRAFDIFMLTTMLPMWYAVNSNRKDHTGMLSTENTRIRMYLNEDYLAELEQCLPILLEKGYLE